MGSWTAAGTRIGPLPGPRHRTRRIAPWTVRRCDNRRVTPGSDPERSAVPPLIVVAGDALVDLIVRPDGEIVPVGGGGPYNSVRAIARLGVPTAWIGGLSSDRFGRMLEQGLETDGVELGLVQRTNLPTTLALAELAADGSAAYHFYIEQTSAPAVHPGPLSGGLPASTRAVLTGTLGMVLEPMATTLEGMVRALPGDVLLVLDPNARPVIIPDPDVWRSRIIRVMARADVFKASAEDLDDLAAWSCILPPLVRRKIFGSGQAGVWLSSRATARGDSTIMPCAASPPSAFCQEKVTTSSFDQSSGCANAAEVASQMVRPARSALIQSALGTRTPEVVPFQVNTTSVAGSTLDRSGSAP